MCLRLSKIGNLQDKLIAAEAEQRDLADRCEKIRNDILKEVKGWLQETSQLQRMKWRMTSTVELRSIDDVVEFSRQMKDFYHLHRKKAIELEQNVYLDFIGRNARIAAGSVQALKNFCGEWGIKVENPMVNRTISELEESLVSRGVLTCRADT